MNTDGTSFGEMFKRRLAGIRQTVQSKAVSGQPPPESHNLNLSSFGPPPLSGDQYSNIRRHGTQAHYRSAAATLQVCPGKFLQSIAPKAGIVSGMDNGDG